MSNPKIKRINFDFYFVGIWWTVSNFGEISGTIAIEMDKGAYIHALDNGLFTLGAPHREGLYGGQAMAGRPCQVKHYKVCA